MSLADPSHPPKWLSIEEGLQAALRGPLQHEIFPSGFPDLVIQFLLSNPRRALIFQNQLAHAVLHQTLTPGDLDGFQGGGGNYSTPEEVDEELRRYWTALYGDEPLRIDSFEGDLEWKSFGSDRLYPAGPGMRRPVADLASPFVQQLVVYGLDRNVMDIGYPRMARLYVRWIARMGEKGAANLKQSLAQAVQSPSITPEQYAYFTQGQRLSSAAAVQERLRDLWRHLYGG